jgi:hypothetical protein
MSALGRGMNMLAYRITQIDSRIVVGTDEEQILVCNSLKMARQIIADARLLETTPAKQIFTRRAKDNSEE